jgi:WD40 repeat protein
MCIAPYQLEAKEVKAHSRIIWDATWSPDGYYFATASRDKTVTKTLKLLLMNTYR